MRRFKKIAKFSGVALAAAAALLLVSAQEYPTHRGGNDRVGRHNASQTANNPGRAVLRWWDPLKQLRLIVDNWEAAASPQPPANWKVPTGETVEAFYFYNAVVAQPDYAYSFTTPSKSTEQPTVPAVGTANTFTWTFGAIPVNQQYELSVNIPVGPTDDDPTATQNLVFPQRYYVYQVSGVVNTNNPGQPVTVIVDTYAQGGGFAKLSPDDTNPDALWVADGTGFINIRLFNTIPRDGQGNLTDPRPNTIVYADAALAVRANNTIGSYIASPTVGQLQVAPTGPYPWRVVAARNEPFSLQVGSSASTYELGNITSFRHDGYNVDPLDDGTGQRNMLWNWPAKRPFADTDAEKQRYALEKRDWILGIAPATPPSRANVTIDKDNLSSNVTVNGAWITNPAIVGSNKGLDYLVAPSGSANTNVVFAPSLNDGNYSVWFWVPNNVVGMATTQKFEVFEGGVPGVNPPSGVATVDMSTATPGWNRLRLDAPVRRSLFAHQNFIGAPLQIRINAATSGGGLVYADSIRFVKQADLSITSTPLQVTTGVRLVPAGPLVQRDVVVVAMENGKLYCLDAKGNANGTTNVYWSYPSEDTTTDPNRTLTEDGPDGIAEDPIGFDLSSALVQTVQVSPGVFEDLLYIGSKNGRVYCIEMAGRGDGVAGVHYGTTRRRWSYPNDYPQTAVTSNLGSIVGSVAFRNTASGQTIFVPTQQGRLFALDAVGDGINKTTTVRWAYPTLPSLPIGPITMTPACEFGKVYFGTGSGAIVGNNNFYAIDENTGLDAWGGPFTGTLVSIPLPYGASSPCTVPAGILGGGMPDTVFVANSNSSVYALNAQTGAPLWETNEIASSGSGSLTFSYMSVYDSTGNLIPAPGSPVVMVPTIDGRFEALFARTADLNRNGLVQPLPIGNEDRQRKAWEYVAEGQPIVSSMATGGRLGTETHSWLYGADSNGYLYAFNFDPSLANQIISVGVQPGQQGVTPNNPSFQNLQQIAAGAKTRILCPTDYEDLANKLRAGTLNYTDITNAAGARQATRRNFEYGETIYVIVYDLPDPNSFSPAQNYVPEFQFNSPGAASQRRQASLQLIPGARPPNKEMVALIAFPVIGTGGNALAPGAGSLTTRIVDPTNQGASVQSSITNFRLANPLSVIVRANSVTNESIGNTTNAADNEVLNNGNLIGPLADTEKVIHSSLGPDPANPGDFISHGQASTTQVIVTDRSLMRLLLGDNRGLQNVRFAINDLAWMIPPADPVYGVYKPLDPLLYPAYEELPAFIPNQSLDYPDIRREVFSITKQLFGAVENPLFSAVGLEPPTWTNGDFTNYKAFPGYNNQLTRTLVPTNFDFAAQIPLYQPPSKAGYMGGQLVYVDANQPGRQTTNGVAQEAYRTFNLQGSVAVDERLKVTTPTIDLGSLPEAAGFTTLAPWLPATPFSPWNTAFNSFFQRFTAFNEGNVNMLNLRVSKFTDVLNGINRVFTPIPLVGPAINELAWLDASLHAHSDLDPQFAPAALNNTVILQKPRPGDGIGSRLSVNPTRRNNPNLNVVQSSHPLLDPLLFPQGDPKIGVTTPFGAAVGTYIQQFWVIEDRNNDLSLGPDPAPVTGAPVNPDVYEPYSDPGFTLRFNVRESRLTNSNTPKTAPMVDNLGLSGNEPFYWSSLQPAALRDGNGNIVMAFSSNRMDNTNAPGWLSRLKLEADASQSDSWRIYFATVEGAVPPALGAGFGASPIRDLNAMAPFSNAQWFRQNGTPYPAVAPSSLFGIQPGETLDASTVKYGSPVFPTNGIFDPLVATSSSGRPAGNQVYMAFLGEAAKRTARGDVLNESRLFIAEVTIGNNGTVVVSNPIGSPYDPLVKKGKPTLITTGNNATAFYTTDSSSLGQLGWSNFNGAVWASPQSIQLSNGFESLGSPSATLRRYRNQNLARIDLLFTAKLRGRSNSEAFFGRLAADNSGRPTGRNPVLIFGTRVDPLGLDPSSGVYWARGVDWAMGNPDLNVPATRIDVFQLVNGVDQSILDQATRKIDQTSKILSYDCLLGGKCYIDTTTGSVRFSGALIPRTATLRVRYAPRFIRISGGLSANYRGAGMLFDDRFIGETSYWANSVNNAIAPTDLARSDRYVVSYGRTSGDGTQSARPFMRTLRFGFQLPTPVQTNSDGTLTQFQVVGMTPGTFYQVDPSSGKVYFMSENEDQTITVTYRGVDESGAPYPNPIQVQSTVGLLGETAEAAIPIEQASNETAVSLALDPQNNPFNRFDYRRPGLIWMFWTSTRAGAPDLYMQTIAPRFTPLPPNR